MPTMAPARIASKQASSSSFSENGSDLNGRALLHSRLVEFGRCHRRAMNPVAPGLRADVDHRIAYALGLAVKDVLATHQAEREGVDQRVERMTFGESDLAADCRNSE